MNHEETSKHSERNDHNAQLNLVHELSRLLAVELDYHYEDEDAEFIGRGVECLIAASTLLKANGLAPSDACSHSIRRFYRKTTDRLC